MSANDMITVSQTENIAEKVMAAVEFLQKNGFVTMVGINLAISATISVAEQVKIKVKNLHQINSFEKFLNTNKTKVSIKLSYQPLDIENKGYQAPMAEYPVHANKATEKQELDWGAEDKNQSEIPNRPLDEEISRPYGRRFRNYRERNFRMDGRRFRGRARNFQHYERYDMKRERSPERDEIERQTEKKTHEISTERNLDTKPARGSEVSYKRNEDYRQKEGETMEERRGGRRFRRYRGYRDYRGGFEENKGDTYVGHYEDRGNYGRRFTRRPQFNRGRYNQGYNSENRISNEGYQSRGGEHYDNFERPRQSRYRNWGYRRDFNETRGGRFVERGDTRYGRYGEHSENNRGGYERRYRNYEAGRGGTRRHFGDYEEGQGYGRYRGERGERRGERRGGRRGFYGRGGDSESFGNRRYERRFRGNN
ncbi:hypothetical protein SteCoe_33725 [Stentor coeruleus]|uniref:DNA/RNA-binding protein Alba-like domain-containing protein n=1 Tax=Stentor coeruleus TaxID=5963 RepID=A0A1R2AWF9_9CILI|nr:hypothetical protein SteCoe_33725 [Stentor coeruleus]